MSKYNRHQSVINRQSDSDSSSDNWLHQLESNLQKAAVQPRSVDVSMFEQINSIMNGKSKYPSVEAAVEDMKARSGLTAYLNKKSETSTTDDKATKTAADKNKVIDKKIDLTPMVIQKCPQIKSTLENYIKDSKGNLSIPAIIEKMRSIHQKDVSDAKDWDDDKLLRLVSKMNLQAKTDNPDSYQNYSNLGKREVMNNADIDTGNTDAFKGLNPVKF